MDTQDNRGNRRGGQAGGNRYDAGYDGGYASRPGRDRYDDRPAEQYDSRYDNRYDAQYDGYGDDRYDSFASRPGRDRYDDRHGGYADARDDGYVSRPPRGQYDGRRMPTQPRPTAAPQSAQRPPRQSPRSGQRPPQQGVPRSAQRAPQQQGAPRNRQAAPRPAAGGYRPGNAAANGRGVNPPQRPRASRDVYVGGQRSPLDQVLAFFAETPWARIAALALGAVLVIVVLVNVVSCVGGALAPQDTATDEATIASSSADEGQAESSPASESSSSAASSTEGVESPWTDNGRFSTGDEELDRYVKQVCDEHSTDGKSFAENALETNTFISRTDYVERKNNQSPWGEDWDREYAKQFFEEGNSGNCYNFAAVTQYVLQYFGYSDAEAQPCIVKLESGNWGDHGLVFVTNKENGKRCIVDDALSADGWMLDIDAYDYDVRNIAQNATVKGNVDALDDDDNPMPIQPGELTEE